MTSARGALNGYQKGKCFYCHRDISIGEADSASADAFFREVDSSYDSEIMEPLLVSENFSRGGMTDGGLVSIDGRPLTRENALYRAGSHVPEDGAPETDKSADAGCDVDHFFPHTLQSLSTDINLDGVWNLVLACPSCNRGEDGKFARVPALKYLERLHERNEFLISSHHPLRETLKRQTGETVEDRVRFLNHVYKDAVNHLIFSWETEEF